MGVIFLFILYLLILVAQITFLVISIRNKKNSNWICLFILEIVSVLLSMGLLIYYNRLPGYGFMPGLSHLGEIILNAGMILLSGLMLFISVCSKIVIFELNLRKENKNYVSPVCLILATSLIFVGVLATGYEILYNIDLEKTNGTVVSIASSSHWGDNVEEVTIEYVIDGEKYEDTIISHNNKIGDSVDIYYNKYNSSYSITFKENTKGIYIPAYLMGVLVVIFRFKDGINKKEAKLNEKK